MFLADVQNSILSNVHEVSGLFGMAAAIASAAFFIANLKIKESTDRNLLLMSQGIQRRFDRYKVQIELLLQRVRDIEGFMKKQGFVPRSEFPSDSLPSEESNTDF